MNLDTFLVILHFFGLTIGMSVGWANMVMAGVIRKAAPQERAVLGRFAPAMGKVGLAGLVILWVSGIAIVMTRYGSFAILPRPFIIKLAAVVLLTIIVIYVHFLQARVVKGDEAAMARIQMLGRMTGPLALIAIIFAVITFG